MSGTGGDYSLGRLVTGQPDDSPCIDRGSESPRIALGTTRIDEFPDGVQPDIGFHYPTGDGVGYLPGDANSNGGLDLGDAIRVLNYLLGIAAAQPSCLIAADFTQDDLIDLTDAIGILGVLCVSHPDRTSKGNRR